MSNFAETVGAILRDIFGSWPPKPRIKKVTGGWVCRSEAERTQAYGRTPEQAYRHWKSAPLVYQPTPAKEASK